MTAFDSKTFKNGMAAEASVVAMCVAAGYRVSLPFGESAPYDMIVDTGSGVYRVQVKMIYSSHKKDSDKRACNFRKGPGGRDYRTGKKRFRDRHYTKDDCDFIVGYCPEKGEIYTFHHSFFSDRYEFTIDREVGVELVDQYKGLRFDG